MAKPKFAKNLTVDFKTLLAIPSNLRQQMAADPSGQKLLSSLTPQQYASLFPDYYQQGKADTSSFTSGGGGGGGGGSQPAGTGSSTAPTAKRGSPSSTPMWMKKLEQIDPDFKGKSDPGAKAELNEKQREVFEALKSGAIKADDPRVAFLKDLKETDLKKAGIVINKSDSGETSYAMEPTKASRMSDEEVKKQMASDKFDGGFTSKAGKLTSDLMRDLGLTKAQAAGLVGNLAHESGGLNVSIEEKVANKHGTKGYGLAQWTDNPPGRGRRTQLMEFAEQNGLAYNSYEAQYKFLIKELQTTEGRALSLIKSAKTPEEAAAAAVAFERPAGYRAGDDYMLAAQRSHGWKSRLDYTARAAQVPDDQVTLPTDASPEQIAAARKKLEEKEHSERSSALAVAANAKLPDGVDPKFAKEFEGLSDQQKVKVAQSIGKVGVEKFNETFKSNPSYATTAIQSNSGTQLMLRQFEGAATGPEAAKETGISAPANAGKMFGAADRSGNNMVPVKTASGAVFRVNKEVAGNFAAFMRDLESRGYHIDPKDRGAGGYNYRSKNGASGLSEHSYGTAIDINPAINTDSNKGKNNLPPDVAQIAQKYGLTWGGLWNRQDTMHFEYHPDHGVPPSKDIASFDETYKSSVASNPDAHINAAAFLGPDMKGTPTETAQTSNLPVGQVPSQGQQPGKTVPLDQAEKGAQQQPAQQPAAQQPAGQGNLPVGAIPQATEKQPGKTIGLGPVAAGPASPNSQTVAENAANSVGTVGQSQGITANSATAQPTNLQQPPPPQQQAQEASSPSSVPVAAEGGEIKSNEKKIEAYPIGALKGDNTVIVDADKNPLFTMNTNTEFATFNPKTQSVTVTPQHKLDKRLSTAQVKNDPIPVLADGGTVDLDNRMKANPDELGATDTGGATSGESVIASEESQDMPQNSGSMTSGAVSDGGQTDEWQKRLKNASENPIQSASFGRAIAQSRFTKSGDAGLGGNYDSGSYALK